jgi:ABC-type multidrug transport system fused ATPase/permease subunit
VITRLKARQEWAFFGAAHRAAPALSVTWWLVLVLRGLMLPLLAVATGSLVGAVNRDGSLTLPLVFVGVVFVLFQVLTPLHFAIGTNLGSRTSNWLNEQLMVACIEPPGVAHLERPALINDLTMARDFDLGLTGPPLSISMDFIASGLVELVSGIAAAIVLFGFAWWAPIVLVIAWGSTHWLLRESAVWRDRNTDDVRDAQRHADYAYRLAVDAPAAKEVRLFGLAGWVVDRFVDRRRRLYELQWHATRLRERPVLGCLAIVVAANALVFWRLADGTVDGRLSLAAVVVYVQTAIGASAIAFGGLSWALDGAAAPAAAVARLRGAMAPIGALPTGARSAAGLPASHVHFRDVTFGYPEATGKVLERFDLAIPAGTSLAIVGQNGAGKTTLAKLLCRLYDPDEGSIDIDGVDLRELDLDEWRSRVTACSRTSSATRRRCATTSLPAAMPTTTRSVPRSSTRERRISPTSTRSSPARTRAGPTCRAASGSGSRSPGRCAVCGSAPEWCCSTSRPRSSTCGARPRSSSGCSPRHVIARRS